MLVDNTPINSLLRGAVSSCIPYTETVVTVGGAYSEPEI